jgi:hypothetical protein
MEEQIPLNYRLIKKYLNKKNMKRHTQILSAFALASFALATSAHANYGWTGADVTNPNDPTDAANYNTTPPTYNSSANSGEFDIQNGTTGGALIYTSAQGTTSDAGSLRVGASTTNGAAPGSELDVTGGSLTFNSGGTSTVGYNGSGTIGVSGGTLSILGADQFWFGNNVSATANISGTGTFVVGDQFLFSRDGGAATLNISGNGVFDLTNSAGTQFDTNGGGITPSVINLSGNGLFEQTASNAIALSTGEFDINFASGSTGQFSLLGETATEFDTLITAGDIEIDGITDTTTSDFTYSSSGSQGVLALAAAPEPTTWAMLFGGFALLFGVQRLHRKRGV